MKRLNSNYAALALAVIAIGVLSLTATSVGAGIFDKKKAEPKEPARIEQLKSAHAKLMQKRADVLKAVQELEKEIIRIEGQIKEQQWLQANK